MLSISLCTVLANTCNWIEVNKVLFSLNGYSMLSYLVLSNLHTVSYHLINMLMNCFVN